MYKSKLQILCQARKWALPEYTPLKDGPDHNPRFTATVTVNDVPFSTTEHSRSSKEALNNAAKIAFDLLTGPLPVAIPPAAEHTRSSKEALNNAAKTAFDLITGPAHVATPPAVYNIPKIDTTEPSCSSKEAQNNTAKSAFEHLMGATPSPPVTAHVAPPIPTSPSDFHAGLSFGGPSTLVNGSSSEVKDSKKSLDSANLYKSRLQNYALKKKLTLPAYSCEREGPPHVPRFRCKVTFQGKTVESSVFYSTIKEAEHAAAKIVWESLDDVQQDDTVLYKNLLQECLQKIGCPNLKYETTTSGPSHMPIFVSKINISGHVYEGQAASSKKQAESLAAKVAYFALLDKDLKEAKERKFSCGLHIERQADFGSGSQIKEALEISSSILQSVIAKDGGLRPKVAPNANLQIPAEISEEYADISDEAPHLSPETDNSAKRQCLPSSDLFDFDSSAFSSYNTNNIHQQVGSTGTKNTTNETIVVRPRVPNMTFSAGASVLPFSDDKWVAVKMNSNH